MKALVTFDFGESLSRPTRLAACSWGSDRRSGQARGARPAHHDPDRDRCRGVRRAHAGQGGRSGIVLRRRDLVIDPRVRHRHVPGRRRSGSDSAGSGGRPSAGTLAWTSCAISHARVGDGDRVLRIHRSDDARRHHRVLEADYARTATMKGLSRQRQVIRRHVLRNALVADGRGHRGADRLPVRRDHRRREDLQLQRDGSNDVFAAQRKDIPT